MTPIEKAYADYYSAACQAAYMMEQYVSSGFTAADRDPALREAWVAQRAHVVQPLLARWRHLVAEAPPVGGWCPAYVPPAAAQDAA